jgi:CRISPR-associated endonuclease/helicase Cas3
MGFQPVLNILNMNISQFFQTLTSFPPRNFQQETITRILNRGDTVLRAPTGSGKTETAIAPFLFAKTLDLDFPNKLIYVVPLRTLANSLRQRTEKLVRNWEAIHQPSRPLVVTLQTGENPEDPRFEGDIIFCTIDQLLSSFLNIPYSVGRGSANVNAGMIFASYLVFDELHLLDPQRSFATVLRLLQEVKGISPFLLMTATLTDELVGYITKIGDEQLSFTQTSFIQVSDIDLGEIESQHQRYFYAANNPLTAQIVWDDIQQNQRQRVIIICNTVAKAQELYRDLDDLNEDNQLNITLLHSRFLPEHRAEKEKYLQERFKKNWIDDGIRDILIATQVIEVGLNITCEVMHTMLCPMSSLLQRAGRCARFKGESGEVFVYRSIEVFDDNRDLDNDDLEVEEAISEGNISQKPATNKRQFLPYDDKSCELTWQVLEAWDSSETVTFRIEEKWINQVHQAETILQAQRRENNQGEFEKQFNQAIFYGDASVTDDLIRFVDSRNIFVWEEPIFFDEQPIDPKKLIAFSIPTPTLCGIWQKYRSLEYEIDWLFKRIENPKGKRSESYTQPVTVPIISHKDLVYSFRILVNPKYLYYDEHVGLRIGIDIEGNGFYSPDKPQKLLPSEYTYRMDNYLGHLVLMWKCWREGFVTKVLINGKIEEVKFVSIKDEILDAAGGFIQTKIFSNVSDMEAKALFEYLVLLAIFTHDLGKLQTKWQSVMRGWQEIAYRDFGGRNPQRYLLAHTDFNPEDKVQRKALLEYEKKYKRPNHAVESAFLANYILQQTLAPLLQEYFYADSQQIFGIAYSVMMAAGRHHSAFAKGWGTKDIGKIGKIELHSEASRAIADSWRCLMKFFPDILPIPELGNLSQSSYAVAEFTLDKFTPQQIKYLQLYSLVVRALRLSDMRSVQLI